MNNFKTIASPVAALLLACGCMTASAATFTITSRDAPGIGFNDPTPVAPVGGNPGTTLGEQRMFVYQYVAGLWGAAIQSNVNITVSAAWEALSCTATGATLGSAGAWNVWYDVPGGIPGTWYPQALANKLAGVNLSDGFPDDGSGYGNVDIKTQFNINLGQPGCLTGFGFYLGIDGNAGTQVNFAATLLHELGHGLGFSVLMVNTANGSRILGIPSIWEQFMYDNTTGKTWLNMTDAERQASAINPLKLAWTGPNAVAGAAQTLASPPSIKVATTVPGYSGFYDYNTASFGPPVSNPSILGNLANITDPTNPVGCNAFNAADSAAVKGKVAIISRGTCAFALKTKNAQNAGAIGVVIANNASGSAPGLGGSDPTITIPTVSVSQTDGATLKAAVAAATKFGSRGKSVPVMASLDKDTSRLAGADAAKRPLLYTPNPRIAGSSVSHWDTSASPNLLMEPNISADLTTSLVPPQDLTVPLLKDLGW